MVEREPGKNKLTGNDFLSHSVSGEYTDSRKGKPRRKPRYREKLIEEGPSALSEEELIAIILNTGTKDLSVGELSSLIVRDITVEGLLNIDLKTLSEFRGMGKAKAARLMAALELGKRVLRKRGTSLGRITSPEDVATMLMPMIKGKVSESIFVLMLSPSGEVLGWREVSKGGIDFVETDISLVLRDPVREGAKRVIIAHNHPSGNLSLSRSDRGFTEKLKKACDSLDIELVDHVVLSGKGNAEVPLYGEDYISFRKEGLL